MIKDFPSLTNQEWRKKVGREIKPKYKRYVDLNNKRAKLNGYSDYGDQWRQKYDSTTFEETVIELYSEMEPLYKQLHAYVRRKLFEVYGKEVTNFLFID